MTKAEAKAGDGLVAADEPSKLQVQTRDDENIGRTLARLTLDPQTRNASLAMSFGSQVFGESRKPDIAESSTILGEEIERAMKGDLSLASRIYACHAVSLDSLFTEMARRAGNNMGHYPQATEQYMRLALKAQSACRSTLEALTKLHQPREQTVKHVHINKGGQAVVADHVHNHTGGKGNEKTGEQSDATRPAGPSAALLGPDPLRDGMPIPSSEGQATVSNARGDESGRAKGK